MKSAIRKRRLILKKLVDAPHSKSELASQMDVSRSTVDRAIRELLEYGCTTKTGAKFEATETGRLALEEHQEYRQSVQTLEASSSILNHVPMGALDNDFLRDASFDIVDNKQPWKVFEKSTELVKRAKSLKRTVPVVFQQHLASIIDSLDNGLDVELIWDRSLYDSLIEVERNEVPTLKGHDQATVLSTDLSESYAIWITDLPEERHAGITVYTDGGVKGVIRNNTPTAVEWALDQYKRRKQDAVLHSTQKRCLNPRGSG